MEDSLSAESTRNTTATDAFTEIEKTLLKIWSDVLNTEIIGVNDDFFSLGGDSMAAMRCMNRINAAFGVELPLSLFLLESAPIAQIASEIVRTRLVPVQIATPGSV